MGETGKPKIQHYRSVTESAVPLAANLADGELALNTTDEKLFFKNTEGTVVGADIGAVDPHIANTSNPHNVTKTQVGLSNVDNTSDIDKPISTLQQAALNLKAPLASPALTGNPTAPTQATGNNTTRLATTAFTTTAVANHANNTNNPHGVTAAQLGAVTSVAASGGTGITISGSPITSSGTITVTNSSPHIATNLSVTPGTTSGPTINSSTGTNVTIPSAGASASGVVTTTTQTFAGAKTFTNTIVGSITGNAETVTDGVYTKGAQNIDGTKTFTNTIVGSITGNAGTVTNGVYTTGNQNIAGIKTFTSTIVGSISGNAATATTATTATTANSLNTGNNYQINSLGVGTIGSGTTGEIRATNDITAYYSDNRLKEFTGLIPDALDKVCQLNGYYFKENNTAKEFGYTNSKVQVGVSAQEVEAVLPEIVTAAPFDIAIDEDGNEYSKSGENYKTIYYDKLVPLLIEAIKELKLEIELLKGN